MQETSGEDIIESEGGLGGSGEETDLAESFKVTGCTRTEPGMLCDPENVLDQEQGEQAGVTETLVISFEHMLEP